MLPCRLRQGCSLVPRASACVVSGENFLVRPLVQLQHRALSTMDFSSDVLTMENKGNAVAMLRLNRPKALNAVSDDVCRDLVKALQMVDADDAFRAIVLTGSGEKAFAAGADIKEMDSRPDFPTVARMDMLQHWNEISKIRKPVIAAVNGFALGGGCELAMMCDIILASDKAKFGQPEIKLGCIPGMGGTQRLTRAVGKSKAMEWILTGNFFTAEQAEKAGLVSRVVPADKLEAEALQLATDIAKMPYHAIVMAKECVNRAYESSLAEGLLYERRAFHATWATADRSEGMKAFVEKREPEWQHK